MCKLPLRRNATFESLSLRLLLGYSALRFLSFAVTLQLLYLLLEPTHLLFRRLNIFRGRRFRWDSINRSIARWPIAEMNIPIFVHPAIYVCAARHTSQAHSDTKDKCVAACFLPRPSRTAG